MCGIVGFHRHAGSSAAVDEGTIEALTETLTHRPRTNVGCGSMRMRTAHLVSAFSPGLPQP